MSLTANDFNEIRNIVESALAKQNEEVIAPLQGEIMALRSDIKEIYTMISDLKRTAITDKAFEKLSLERKILTLHAELIAAARQAGIKLPK